MDYNIINMRVSIFLGIRIFWPIAGNKCAHILIWRFQCEMCGTGRSSWNRASLLFRRWGHMEVSFMHNSYLAGNSTSRKPFQNLSSDRNRNNYSDPNCIDECRENGQNYNGTQKALIPCRVPQLNYCKHMIPVIKTFPSHMKMSKPLTTGRKKTTSRHSWRTSKFAWWRFSYMMRKSWCKHTRYKLIDWGHLCTKGIWFLNTDSRTTTSSIT